MTKIVKGVFKGVKKIVKGIGKVFKKVITSPIGKIALIGLAIYSGGVALGAWGGVGGVTGAGVSGAIAGAPEAATAYSTALATGGSGVGGVIAGAPEAATAYSAAAEAAGAGVGSTIGTAGTGVPAVVGPSLGTSLGETLKGVGSKAAGYLSSAGTWAEANPLLASTLVSGLGSAFSPDEEDILKERERIRRERYQSLIGASKIEIGPSDVPFHQRIRR